MGLRLVESFPAAKCMPTLSAVAFSRYLQIPLVLAFFIAACASVPSSSVGTKNASNLGLTVQNSGNGSDRQSETEPTSRAQDRAERVLKPDSVKLDSVKPNSPSLLKIKPSATHPTKIDQVAALQKSPTISSVVLNDTKGSQLAEITPRVIEPLQEKPVQENRNDTRQPSLANSGSGISVVTAVEQSSSKESGTVVEDGVKEGLKEGREKTPDSGEPSKPVTDSAVNQAASLASAAPAVNSPAVAVKSDLAAELPKTNAISGTMVIRFDTRAAVEPDAGAKDHYLLNLKLGSNFVVKGEITRQPEIKSRFLGRKTQETGLIYSLEFHKAAALLQSWGGFIEEGVNGEYNLKKLTSTKLNRSESFNGQLQTKKRNQPATSKLQSLNNYVRQLRGKQISISPRHIDPVAFKDIVIPASGEASLPEVVVNGNLDYDYDTGNWLTNGVTFSYQVDGKQLTDLVTGSIKWQEDPDRSKNGRGSYLFNLRWNEAKALSNNDEAAVFDGLGNDESAFFATDSSIPALLGTVDYQDSLKATGEGEEPIVLLSRVNYSLTSQGLTQAQVGNFLRVWLLMVGPANDE